MVHYTLKRVLWLILFNIPVSDIAPVITDNISVYDIPVSVYPIFFSGIINVSVSDIQDFHSHNAIHHGAFSFYYEIPIITLS